MSGVKKCQREGAKTQRIFFYRSENMGRGFAQMNKGVSLMH